MRKVIVESGKAPAAIGPYSHAVRAGGLLFISGQIPVDPSSGAVVNGGIERQARRALENLGAVLHSQGLSFPDVVKTTVFLQSMEDFDAVNRVYGEYFQSGPPARSCVQVARLPKDARLEIEAIALCG
ncbi:MAG: RidA family protein [bacterium]|nr:RidA family protein [bacterium]